MLKSMRYPLPYLSKLILYSKHSSNPSVAGLITASPADNHAIDNRDYSDDKNTRNSNL